MCPFCLSNAALLIAGTVSTGGAAIVTFKRSVIHNDAKNSQSPQNAKPKEK
jgi:hypothetical protein